MLIDGQHETIVKIIATVLGAIDQHRQEVKVDPNDLGTLHTGHRPDLEMRLKRYKTDPVGQALRMGLKDIGAIVAPHASFPELQAIAGDAADRSQNAEWSLGIIAVAWDGLSTTDGRTWSA